MIPSSSSRPQSRASLNRPLSSASRPLRPNSRLSGRPSTRQPSRLHLQSQTLVTQVTGISAETDDENFKIATEFVVKNLDLTTKTAAGLDISAVDKHISGHIQKSLINSRDELAEALGKCYLKLKTQIGQSAGIDQEIKASRLPDHMQLLVALSAAPTESTSAYAELYLEHERDPPKGTPQLTWKDILADDPYEGDHWRGVYGLPPGSTKEGWELRSEGSSTPSLSPLEDDDDYFARSMSSIEPSESLIPNSAPPNEASRPAPAKPFSVEDVREFESLQARQYWGPRWKTDIRLGSPFDLGDPTTLGPAFNGALSKGKLASVLMENERYIREHDAVREVLIGLQGRQNMLFEWARNEEDTMAFVLTAKTPRLTHLTSSTQTSILESFARTATTAEHLRKYVTVIFGNASRPSATPRRNTHTMEAFADAVDEQTRALDRWCAERERRICEASSGHGSDPLIVSLLSLEKALRTEFSNAFTVLLELARGALVRTTRSRRPGTEIWLLAEMAPRMSPAASTAWLLDDLFRAAQAYSAIGDRVTARVLVRVSVSAAEPVWAMVGRWLKDGMPVRVSSGLDEEFFIEDNELMLLDPDFWSQGYVLRTGGEETSDDEIVPSFLSHVAGLVLGSGKATGLLRALGSTEGRVATLEWRSFETLLAADVDPDAAPFELSVDTLSRLVYDELSTRCESTGKSLVKLFVDECDLLRHLHAIEDLYLMRRGNVMAHFADVLFSKMDTSPLWTDFHFLNSAFGDVVRSSPGQKLIESSLVRLSFRARCPHEARALADLDGLAVEYGVPFPVTYVLNPGAMRAYGSVFVLLMQLRRTKGVLDRISIRGVEGGVEELKLFYAIRSRCSWFVNALFSFLTTYVIHTQVVRFHERLESAKSLDEMIRLHNEHIDRIQSQCFLQDKTTSLHRAIIAILDLCLCFSTSFTAYDLSRREHDPDASRRPNAQRRRRHHRSRRQQKLRKNVISFSDDLDVSSSSSDDDQDDERLGGGFSGTSFSFGGRSAGGDMLGQMDNVAGELDRLVKYVRKSVESLSGGTGDVTSAYAVFAFTLEDWDS